MKDANRMLAVCSGTMMMLEFAKTAVKTVLYSLDLIRGLRGYETAFYPSVRGVFGDPVGVRAG